MSSIYITEPNTEGKVLLHTTFGDLDVELWPQQAPKAVRNFVQLCLEGVQLQLHMSVMTNHIRH
jgi:peptidyl-prolyl cis-trans isomerase SDCCAG10